jgi:uncharacterized protein YutE (UPF0331/DUF86 family)
MSPGRIDAAVVRRHLLALDEALQVLRSHQGRSMEELISDPEECWIVERGLQLCAQNALDVATHLAASTQATPKAAYSARFSIRSRRPAADR